MFLTIWRGLLPGLGFLTFYVLQTPKIFFSFGFLAFLMWGEALFCIRVLNSRARAVCVMCARARATTMQRCSFRLRARAVSCHLRTCARYFTMQRCPFICEPSLTTIWTHLPNTTNLHTRDSTSHEKTHVSKVHSSRSTCQRQQRTQHSDCYKTTTRSKAATRGTLVEHAVALVPKIPLLVLLSVAHSTATATKPPQEEKRQRAAHWWNMQ